MSGIREGTMNESCTVDDSIWSLQDRRTRLTRLQCTMSVSVSVTTINDGQKGMAGEGRARAGWEVGDQVVKLVHIVLIFLHTVSINA